MIFTIIKNTYKNVNHAFKVLFSLYIFFHIYFFFIIIFFLF